MKHLKGTKILVVILLVTILLAVGYAAITKSIQITGTTLAIPNDENFKVEFTAAEVTSESYSSSSGEATATYSGTEGEITVSGMSAKGDKVVFTYTITNSSTDLSALIETITLTNTNETYFSVTTEGGTGTLEPLESTTVVITVECIKTIANESQSTTIEISLPATAVENTTTTGSTDTLTYVTATTAGGEESPVFDKEFNWYIYTVEQLQFLSNFTNNANTLTTDQEALVTAEGYDPNDIELEETTTVYLMNNLDLGATWDEDGTLTSGTEWTPIGKEKANACKATFEGNGHTIKGVYINSESTFNGIFGNTNTVKNLTIKDSYIEGGICTGGIVGALRSGTIENCNNINTTVILKDGENYTVGGICGQFTGTEIKNCINTGTVIAYGMESSSGYNYAGGVVGRLSNSGTAANCTNAGEVTGAGCGVGGVVGYANTSTTVESCTNSGEVTGEGDCTGGVVGCAYTSSTVISCTNSGEVTGEGQGTGGVVGYVHTSSTVESCTNSGAVTGAESYVGGVVGYAYTSSTVESCTNRGAVTGEGSYVGGIVGDGYDSSTVENCTNSGAVTGEGSRTGGVVGWTSSTVASCTNSGSVTGSGNYVGGVVGFANTSSTVESCTNSGAVVGQGKCTGGIAGVAANIVTKCANTGEVTGTTDVGGIVGDCVTGYAQAISKCYNSGAVTGTESVGGISGWLGDDGATETECYNKGIITGTTNVGTVIGYMEYDATVSKCYYYTTDDTLVGIGAIENEDSQTLDEARQGTILTTEDLNSYEEFITWIEGLE